MGARFYSRRHSASSSSPADCCCASYFATALARLAWPSLLLLFTFCFSMQVSAKEGPRALQALNSEMDVCFNFSNGDRNKGEFYSPFYPNNYPNNTECIALITAPFGSFIRVEFRDQFHLEDSQTCEYDRLEIRNGQFGYSDLIDIICGHNFPPEISSTDRYLWLRFKSDESIEYSGFRAVYHFVPLPSCYFEKSGASGKIRSSEMPEEVFNYSETYKTPLECIWNITVQPGWKMYINFDSYQLVKPNDCDVNYIDIYESVLSEEKRKARFCGTATEPQKSDGSIINIRFHAKEGVIDANQRKNFQFEILFTAFRQSDKEKCNPKTEFDCDDGTCIDLALKCNGDFNCKYRYDEDAATTCLKGGKGVLILTSEHMIIILIVFFALVIGMCASIIVSCWGKIQERRQRELEYKMRRSREVSVEQGLDRTVTVTSLDRNMGSEFATLPAVLGQRNPKLGDSSLLRGSRDEDDGCYVPDVDLDFRKGNGQLIDDKYSPATPPVQPECPLYLHHHQQRDSLRSGSESPIPPPPPPPALSHLRGRRVLDSGQDATPSPTDNHVHRPDCAQHGSGDYRAQSLGAGRLDEQEEELDDEKLVPLSSRAQSMRFRAEAVIEMGSGPSLMGGVRPRSFAEMRSAPDVVVLR